MFQSLMVNQLKWMFKNTLTRCLLFILCLFDKS